MDSLRYRPGIEVETGEWRTRGLSISVGKAERLGVCRIFMLGCRNCGRDEGIDMVAVGVAGNEIGWRRLRGGGCEGGV